MAIARLWQACAEFNQWGVEFDGRTSVNFVTSAVKAKTGTYSFRENASGGWKFFDSISQCRAGLWLNHNDVAAGDRAYIIMLGTSKVNVISVCLNDSGGIVVYDGSNNANVLGTGAAACPTVDTWYHIGIDIKVDVAGWAYVYVDGVEVVGFDGDTTNSGSAFDTIYIGYSALDTEADAQWTNWAYFDDIFLDSSTGEVAPAALEQARFTLLNPNGNGYSSDFNGSDGDSVDNYLLVDEVAHDADSTYVYQDTAAENDGYECENVTLDPGESVLAVIPVAIAHRTDPGGTVNIDIGERLSGVNQVSSPASPGTSYGLLWERHTAKPGGGTWTEADVNSAEMVIETT